MSQKTKGLVRLLARVNASIMLVMLLATPAFAAITPKQYISDLSKKNYTIYISPGKGDFSFVQNPMYYVKSGKVGKVTSSNKKVITARARKDGRGLVLEANRTGKATITYKHKGKRHKVTVTVKSWKNPVKKFTVGKSDETEWLDSNNYLEYWSSDAMGKKLNIQPAKGWKLISIKFLPVKSSKFGTIKNGATISRYGDYYAIFRNTQNGGYEYINLYVYNGSWD